MFLGRSNSVACIRQPDSSSKITFSSGLHAREVNNTGAKHEGHRDISCVKTVRIPCKFDQVCLLINVIHVGHPHSKDSAVINKR